MRFLVLLSLCSIYCVPARTDGNEAIVDASKFATIQAAADAIPAMGGVLSANTFTIVKKVGVVVRSESASITISSNNFSDTWIGNDANGKPLQKRDNAPTQGEQNPNEAAGILLEACKGVVVSGNLFSRLSHEAILQTGECRKILLSGNGVYEDE